LYEKQKEKERKIKQMYREKMHMYGDLASHYLPLMKDISKSSKNEKEYNINGKQEKNTMHNLQNYSFQSQLVNEENPFRILSSKYRRIPYRTLIRLHK